MATLSLHVFVVHLLVAVLPVFIAVSLVFPIWLQQNSCPGYHNKTEMERIRWIFGILVFMPDGDCLVAVRGAEGKQARPWPLWPLTENRNQSEHGLFFWTFVEHMQEVE